MQTHTTTRNAKWIAIAAQYYEIKQQRQALAKQESLLFKQLKEMSHNKTKRAGNFIFTFTTRTGPIDYSRIPELTRVDLEQYRKEPVICWKLIRID